jgi:cobalt-zinc-cadmium efflux system membrane fusion protein
MSMSATIHYPGVLTLLIGLVAGALPATGHTEEALIKLTATQLKTAGITVATARAPDAGAAPDTGNTLRLTGRVAVPNRGIELVTATTAGQVQAVLVNVGETVRTGTPLARLYSPELLGMQREYLHARSSAELADQKLKRDEALFQDGIISRSRLEETRNGQMQAQASLQVQQQLLKLSGMSAADISKLTNASVIDPVLTITSGLNGVVLEQSATPGGRVEPGTPLFTLGNTRTLWVELQATPAQLGQLQVGNPVTATGCQQQGKLIAISPQVSRDSQTALVRAEFTNAGNCLRPNQYAEVSINGSGDSQAAVSIPAKALVRSSGKDYVFVQTPAGFRLQEVTVLARQTEVAWVSNTLAAGTQVAVSGVAALRGAASGLGPE